MKYTIIAQLAKPDAPELRSVRSEINKAWKYFNTKSAIATNPKTITSIEYIDASTMQITLNSEAVLPVPAKGLRVFSEYLIKNGLEDYVYSKTLFKYTVKNNEESQNSNQCGDNLDTLKVKTAMLLFSASKEQVEQILKILEG